MSRGKLLSNQQGLVSFLVVTVIMLISTLIVMSYARVVQREQVQTLDRQLNIQALYAAESGVNDAMNALASNASLANGAYSDCDDFSNAASLNTNLGDGVSYSCLLVDASPTRLDYDGVNTNSSTVIPLRVSTGSNINTIEISWDSDVSSPVTTGCDNNPNMPLPATWPGNCDIGMIRFELLPFTSMSRDDMISRTAVGFLKPFTSNVSNTRQLSFFQQGTVGDKGEIVGVRCNGTNPRRCVFRITDVNVSQAYLRVKSVYRNTPLTIRAFDNGAPSTPLGLHGAQIAFDVTGRASGVVKRIKVNKQVPNGNTGIAPEFALQSKNTLCKQFTFRPGAVSPNDGTICDPTAP